MIEHLTEMIKSAIGCLWNLRFRTAVTRSHEIGEFGVTAEVAYRRGYSDGYWDGTTDLLQVLHEGELALLQLSTTHVVTPLPSTGQNLSEVH